ncbi:MAG: transporter substrate-binding protein, partial [Planctomycetia bacterium]
MPTRPLPATGLLSRRQSLARAAALLAAVRAAAPAGFFAGCSLGIPKRARTVSVGLLHSQTGTMAVSETGVRDSELYAFERINAAGGLLGHPVEVSAPDT